MQILRPGHKAMTLSFVVCGAALVAACGGVTTFSGQAPVSVVGDLPPPPPPPPPKKEEPPPPPARVEVRDNKIEIREKIQFDHAKATIKEESNDLLNEIVDVIKKNPHIKKISIEGHASSEGDAGFNKRLSGDRAKSVMQYLIEQGIDQERIQIRIVRAQHSSDEAKLAANKHDLQIDVFMLGEVLEPQPGVKAVKSGLLDPR